MLPDSWAATPELVEPTAKCSAAKEYVTALEFLRRQKEMQVPEEKARELADQVAKGCNGASQRFIQIALVLTRAGLGTRDALDTGVEYAMKDAASTQAFLHIFNRAFLSEYLDLDMRAAFKMAKNLSGTLDADHKAVRDDFSRLSDFCVKEESLDLPKPVCGTMAARITALGNKWGGGVAHDYLETYHFLKSQKGPGMTTANALKLAEEIISLGVSAPSNFSQAYRYASSSSGLSLPVNDAIQFAKKLAAYRPVETHSTNSQAAKK